MFGRAIFRQRGQSGKSPVSRHSFFVDLGLEVVGGPDAVAVSATASAALQVMDGAVAFADAMVGKTRFLELPVDIAGEHETAMRQPFADPAQDGKARVGNGPPVELQAMPVEAPGEAGLALEGGRIGNLLEGDARATERRVGAPETLRAAKIGQA
jgi:hypothetical protein